MKLTNRWNRFTYRLWSPVYDALFDGLFASPGRKRAMQVLNVQPGERVLLAGVGTGADLPLLPRGVEALGIDLSPEMLGKARAKLPLDGGAITLLQGDAQQLDVADGTFDVAVLNLILSVVPDGSACFRETLRALKPGGRGVIFDKFAPEGSRTGTGRKLINLITMFLGTDITRRFSEVTSGCSFQIICDEPSLLRGMYRIILFVKNDPVHEKPQID